VSPAGHYRVEYDSKALKELSKLDKSVTRRIVRAVNELRAEPRPAGCRALTGYPGLWRIRVGNYRVVYTIKDAELIVLALHVAHRSTVYRQL
jgi:mRNA interferase RelE/StbE